MFKVIQGRPAYGQRMQPEPVLMTDEHIAASRFYYGLSLSEDARPRACACGGAFPPDGAAREFCGICADSVGQNFCEISGVLAKSAELVK